MSMLNVLRNLFTFENPPTKVLDVKLDSYISRDVLCREDGLVLHTPTFKSKNENQYEIVLHRPCSETMQQAFSLFRSANKEEAEMKFIIYKDKVPDLLETNKQMYNVNDLQKLCDALLEHPSWNLAHLAAHLCLYDCFNDPKVKQFLNGIELSTGMSPLQVAIMTNNLKTVEALVNSDCSLDHLDHDANSVFHYAANTDSRIMQVLCKQPLNTLNHRNNIGFTPLHTACRADKKDCVEVLLKAGADVNIPCIRMSPVSEVAPGYVADFFQNGTNKLYWQDIKYGGTPLHWSCSRPVIESLIKKNCDINALNFDRRTALHIMVMRNRTECVVALLSNGADPNILDCDGNSPLHLAIKEANIPIIQSLLIFSADVDLMNLQGATPRHQITPEQEPKLLYFLHSVGASRCPPGMSGCTEGCVWNGNYAGIPPPPVIGPPNRDVLNKLLDVAAMGMCSEAREAGKGTRLLCLDGGGIRGLILIEMLLEIERVAQRPIVNCFDWVAGTSTGGILALGLASGKTLHEVLCLYFRMKEHTFVGKKPYRSEALEAILQECFGCDTVMTDIEVPRLMITGVLADRTPVDLHLFRNYQSPSDVMGIKHDSPYELPPPPEEQLLWHVGRATGAAPSYFRAFGRYLDGGLIANNPTLDALTEIHELKLALRAKGLDSQMCNLKVVVSLGTGVVPATELKDIDIFRPDSLWDGAKLVMGVSAIGRLLVDQATQSDGRVVDRARAWCSMIGVPFFRFSPQMSEDVDMDEKSDAKLVWMLWETKSYMYQNSIAIKELVELLKN